LPDFPRGARRVFKGKIFDVYQWKQKLFDGSYGTFERLKRPDTVTIIPILGNGKVMIVREQQPGTKSFLSVIGGRVDPGERIIEAARRELLEETGYSAGKLIPWLSWRPYNKIVWTIYVFIAKNCKKVAPIHLDAGEKIKPKFITLDKLINLVLMGNVRLPMELTQMILRAKANPREMKKLRKLFSK